MPKKYFLNPFLGHFQKSETGSENMSRSVMLLVLKNCLKKHSSLINDWVIDVWSQCKKCDGGKKGREWEGTSSGLGFWFEGN